MYSHIQNKKRSGTFWLLYLTCIKPVYHPIRLLFFKVKELGIRSYRILLNLPQLSRHLILYVLYKPKNRHNFVKNRIKLTTLKSNCFDVTVVIVTKNSPPTFENTLRSYTNQINTKVNIIIVDSGSTDDTLLIAKKYGAQIISIKPNEFGHAISRNLGVMASKSKYIAVTVNDAVPLNLFLLNDSITYMESHQLDAVSVRQLPFDDSDLFSAWCVNSHMNFITGGKAKNFLVKAPYDYISLSGSQQRKYCVLDDVFVIHRSSTIQSNPYSPKIKFGEDLEYSHRLLRQNYRLGFISQNGVIHSHNRDAVYFLKRYFVDTLGVNAVLHSHPNNFRSIQKDILNSIILPSILRSIYFEYASHLVKGTKPLSKLLKMFPGDEQAFVTYPRAGQLFEKLFLDTLNRFDRYYLSTIENSLLINPALRDAYNKLLYMTLGISLGEIFIILHESNKIDSQLHSLQQFLYEGI